MFCACWNVSGHWNLSESLDFSDAEGDALPTAVNRSELLWFYRNGSPTGTDWEPGAGVRQFRKWQESRCSLLCSLCHAAR